MDNLKRLALKFKNRPFSYSEIKRLGMSQGQLNQLLKAEALYRIGHGVYILAGSDLSEDAQFRGATLRIDGPSAVCLLSALFYHGLTDEIPRKVWLLVPENKHTAHKDIRLVRSRNPQWGIGIEKNQGFSITSVERSLVDSLIMKRLLSVHIGVAALKVAVKTKKTTLDKVLKMAKLMDVEHRLSNYIEALA